MTGELVSQSHRRTDDPHWRSILADLAFWSVAGAIVATMSGRSLTGGGRRGRRCSSVA
ncbi:hypothetical protein I553_4083 [Mycobacterium xenopi 4042]|uniref:Uncharacterized protein n=1 Tax=Mycobacterium xenopi 4042 TaxID=1299334 RepID=X8AG69_MYCXE|nr:hypothetical protein I553_4083 [Mycobacterium xenopi 4042]